MGAFPAIASNSEQLTAPVNGTLDSLAQRNAEPGSSGISMDGWMWLVRLQKTRKHIPPKRESRKINSKNTLGRDIYIYIIYIYVIWYSSQDGIAADIETNVWFLGCLVVLMATRNPARKPPFGNFFYNGLMGCLPNINWLAGFLPFSPYVWWFFHDWYHDSMQISLIRDFLQWQTGKMSDFFRGEWRKVAVVAACCRYTCCHIL